VSLASGTNGKGTIVSVVFRTRAAKTTQAIEASLAADR
jgi:hypothetical protein